MAARTLDGIDRVEGDVYIRQTEFGDLRVENDPKSNALLILLPAFPTGDSGLLMAWEKLTGDRFNLKKLEAKASSGDHGVATLQ
jgi:hypothetical protein